MNPYKNLIIFYFSGTGNALSVSKRVSEIAALKGLNTKLIAIDRFKKIEWAPSEDRDLIGFCYPTHGFSLPWIMMKFILLFPKGRNADFFLINTRAGMKMGKYYVRGLSGIAQHLPLLILLLKGFKLIGLMPVDLPSNWISIHPGLKAKVVDSIYEKRAKEISEFADRILERKRTIASWYFLALPLDIVIAPVAFGYFVYGRFFFSKTFIAGSDCNSCKLCEQNCPTESIILRNGRPYWRFTCESCMRCINICPSKSIQASHSLAGLIIIVSLALAPVTVWLNKIIGTYLPFLSINSILTFVIKWSMAMAVYFLCYLFVFYSMRVKFINKLFVFTSLTKYWRRYRSPEVSTADFKIHKK